MVKDGYIKVIVTTNFDRLLEMALATVGILPDVISTADQIKGALPLIHSKCTILKINGDYMDTRIKNTITELSSYDEAMNKYLSRVLDEFGLIICGWSGEWDTALKDNIFRCESNRFTTYWLQKGQLTDSAQRIIAFKHAQVINIESADSFFEKLQDNLISLDDLSMRQDPLSIDVACATLKRLLPDTKNIIKINDLIMDECKRVINKVEHLNWSVTPDKDTIRQKIEQIENICKPILFLASLGCYWGNNSYNNLWAELFLQLSDIKCSSSYEIWENISNYPCLMVMYIILISCIKSDNYELLYIILNNVKSNKVSRYEPPKAISTFIYPQKVIDTDICNEAIFNGEQKFVPVSERLFDVLREPSLQIINSENDYADLFDKAEFFYAVNYWYNRAADKTSDNKFESSWAPIGRFRYKLYERWNWENAFNTELSVGSEWSAIKYGFFAKSINNFIICSKNVYEFAKKLCLEE